VLALANVTAEEASAVAWVVDENGRRYAGAAAINRALEELRGGWPAIAALYDLAPIRVIEDAAYRRFARHRGRIARFIPKSLL
jgi:predicted DCC family thiol-disulfide oxidoreductase YuxK